MRFPVNEETEILLIEDSPSQALCFKLLLQRAGYQVQIIADGAEGWRRVCACQPRLILLDIDLPSLDGFQILSRLKRGRSTSWVPVIMLTNRNHVSNVLRAMELGAQDYLFKDDAPSQLCAVVGQILHPADQGPADHVATG